MGDRERIRRPDLGRTTPIRNWSNVVSTAPNPTGDPVGADVQNANRVVEEYLRAGEASARMFQRAMGTASGAGDSQDIAQRISRATSDLMSFWLELFARTAGSNGQPAGRAAPAAASPVAAAPARENQPAESMRVSVEIASVLPVTVSIDLKQEARGSRLCVDRLHSRSSKAAPIEGIEIDTSRDDRFVVIRVRIASDQPAGVYNGVILDEESSLPAGTMSVNVHAAGKASGRSRPHERRRRNR